MMQKSVQEKHFEVSEQDYPYLLRGLRERFGEVYRTGNDFWATGGEIGVVATLLSPTRLQLVGEDVFNPEIAEVSQLVKEARTRGRPVRVTKVLHWCSQCPSFYTSRTELSHHESKQGEIHRVVPLVEGGYTVYVPALPPFEQRKGWISRDRLVEAFAKYVGPDDAETMADLRITSYREGLGLSVQEMVQGTARIPEIVSERYGAYRDAVEATMCPPVYANKRTPSPLLSVLPAIEHPIQNFRTLVSTFVDWKVKVDGKVLSQEQMVEAAVRLGLPYGLTNRAAIDAAFEAEHQIEESGELPDYSQILADAAKDEALMSDDQLAKFMKRDRKLASEMRKAGSSPRRVTFKEKHLWRDHARDPKSPRYEAETQERQPQQRRPQPQLQQRPLMERADPEKEKQAFLARFDPTEVIDLGNGLVKAKTTFNSHSISVFNSVFYPQRHPEPGEFPETAVSLAEEIAKATDGKVVVSTKRDKWRDASLAYLDVVIDGKYTVRVTLRDLSVKLEKAPDLEQEKKDFIEKFSLKPADIVYEKDGFIKTTKAVTTRFGSGTLEVFNTVFAPQRLPMKDEFGEEAEQIAEQISSKMGGSVVVTEYAKRGTKHLDIVFGTKHTVRVAYAPLSSPLSGGDK